MFGLFKKKSPSVMDGLIHTVYGANSPPKSADLERSITIAHEDLLFERVPLSEVKRHATELFKGPMPYSTYDLAVSTALAFFHDRIKSPEYVPALQECYIPARLRVLNWAKEGKVGKLLAESFVVVLDRIYKPRPSKAPEQPPVTGQEAVKSGSEARNDGGHPTVKDLLKAREPPWNRVDPAVINAILEAITDKGLLEAFVMHSMNTGLVARYEALGRAESDPTLIRAQISMILCETGNRAIPALANALAEMQWDAGHKAIMLAGDSFEAAIALAKNQIAAYAGLAQIYGLVGKSAELHKYARLGLSELEKMRRDPAASAMRDSSIFPPDILDQAERQLRIYLKL
jgi:hypothetical protein